MKRNQSKQAQCSERRGALTVEFALVAPILFIFFTGSLELTAMNLMRQTAGNAAYEAARTAAISGNTEADAQAVAQQLLASVGATNNVTIAVVNDGATADVTITIPVSDNSWGLGRFTGNLTIVKRCSLSLEL